MAKDFRDRLKKEFKELNKKLEKLSDFIETQDFEKLSDEMKNLLMIQVTAMATYSNVLSARIKYLEGF